MNDKEPKTQKTTAELELVRRRELALQTINAVSEVLEHNVTISQLETLEVEGSPDSQLIAKRALRCIASIADKKQTVINIVGEDGIYNFAEGVITYGASDQRYLALMEQFDLNAAETTGVYALRELIAEHTGGARPSFQQIGEALKYIGVTFAEAGRQPDETVAAFYEAGFFTDHLGGKQFDWPIFYPTVEQTERVVEDDSDGSITAGIREGIRADSGRPPEEDEIEGDREWAHADRLSYLKSLGF